LFFSFGAAELSVVIFYGAAERQVVVAFNLNTAATLLSRREASLQPPVSITATTLSQVLQPPAAFHPLPHQRGSFPSRKAAALRPRARRQGPAALLDLVITLRLVQRCPSPSVLSSLMGIDSPLPRAPSRRTRCHRACADVAPSPPVRHRSPFRTSVAPSPLGAFPSVKATAAVSSRTATAPSPPARLPQHAFPFCSVSALSPPVSLMGIDSPLPRAPSRRTRCHRACAAVAPSPPVRHRSPFRTS